MSRRLAVATVVARSRAQVFAWVADYRHAAALDGVREWRPLDPGRSTGPGARFRVRLALPGIVGATVLELDRWLDPEEIGWHADGGPVEVRGDWTFAPHPAGTEVALAIAYTPPGGPLGSLGAVGLEGIARRRLQSWLEAMRDALEPDSEG